jgi:carboxyl-terminal processing protease
MRAYIYIFFGINSLFASSIKYSDIKQINDKLFSSHILFESFDENIANRSVEKMMESFDPVNFYFFEQDKKEFSKKGSKIVSEYKANNFDTYIAIQERFIESVKRCRKVRAKVRSQIVQETIDINLVNITIATSSPLSEKEQEEYIKSYMISHLKSYARSKGVQNLSSLEMAKVLDFHERAILSHEERYIAKENQPLIISKMIASSLDAHSMVYANEEISMMNAHLKNRLEGIGIYVHDSIDGAVITGCVKSGPAERSKSIEEGDVILVINGYNVKDRSFKEVMGLLSVKEGAQIVLQLQSKNGEKKVVKLTGEKIEMKEDKILVDTEPFLDGQIVKIRVDTFYNDFEGGAMADDLKQTVLALRRKMPVYGVIIDMRKNLGGFFREAVKSISLFSPKGTVVVAKFRDDQVRYSKEYDPHITYSGPIVILTSKYSASAAEILAQALQDTGVAIIAGDETSYGKGSIQFQTITDPSSLYKYKVTVGKYYTVSGTSPQLKGVRADILVPSEYCKRNIGEKYLTHALPSGDLKTFSGLHPEVQAIFDYQSTRKKTAFEIMKPALKKNSEIRISNNKDYQAFLRSLEGYAPSKEAEDKRKALFGKNDLQMMEATMIIKDMHAILETYK